MSPTINRTAKYYNTDAERAPELIKAEELHPIISLLETVVNYVTFLLNVFGLTASGLRLDSALSKGTEADLRSNPHITPELLSSVAQFRSTVRKELLPLVKQQNSTSTSPQTKNLSPELDKVIKKLLAGSDEIRDKFFPGLGYSLKDLSDGSFIITPKQELS